MGRIILRLLRKIYFYRYLSSYSLAKKEDITVIIGVKDIFDCQRMINNFESIRNQDYDQSLIRITLVDYDSNLSLSRQYQEMCNKYNALYTRVSAKSIWNRAHALNIGIKKVKTKYILCTDVDILFEKNYLKEAVRELKKDPLQVIIAPLLDLPDVSIGDKGYSQLKSLAQIRNKNMDNCAGTNLALTYFYHKIRGYDEQYKMWGSEDKDLIKRFKLFALKVKSIENSTFYLHQYHPRFRNLEEIDGFKNQVMENRMYFKNNNSIIRNCAQWGSPE